ncbi:hypothetical protein HPP92_026521 [Vanilla planifolia]|uniref:Uncharacterized protein n=1 Tax=Vanilla planifolia TaxID=51239 RepID=A0A835PGK3_VANPL|nr:hypothetical protein HPP92_026521 [Vanilla planifolia]
MSANSPFDQEHPGVDDGNIVFPAIGEGHFVFEDKNLVYSEEDQIQHELEVQMGEESHADVSATILWKHVIKGRKCGSAHGGSHVFKCKHCHKIYHGTYTRVYAHLMGHKKGESKGIGYCSVVKADRNLQLQIKREVEQVESSPNVVPLKRSKLDASYCATSKGPSLVLSYAGSFGKDFSAQEKDDVDSKVIRCLCANGIPFNILRSPYWEEMVSAISKQSGYKSPSCERASAILLRNERVRVERELDDFKQKWSHYGISILLSGWNNVKTRSLISMIASNQFGSMFLHAVDFLMTDNFHKKMSISLLEVIENVGPYNVIQVVTDNASSCKSAMEEVMKSYPYVFWSPCFFQTLKLIMKDIIIALPWLEKTYINANGIVMYITHHSHAIQIFHNYLKLELLKAATGQYASYYYIFQLLYDVRDTLIAAVLSDQWDTWSSLPIIDEKVKLSGDSVKLCILSENFWEAIQMALSIMKPIYKTIKFTDQKGPLIGEVCDRMGNMLGEIKDNLKENQDIFMIVREKINSKWSKSSVPLQCLAYALTPKYYDEDFIQVPAPGGRKRCPPDQDDDIFEGAMAAICKLHLNDEQADTVRVQFMSFVEKKGKFSSQTAKRDSRNPKINVLQWWKFHGGETRELRDMAFRVLAQSISATSIERPCSSYAFFHNTKRNHLSQSQADDLLFIHSNLRLLSRFNPSYKHGLHRKWDVNQEHVFIDESSLQWEETHVLNLDEENSLLSQASHSHSSIQELLRIIEDVSPNNHQASEESESTSDIHLCEGRGRAGLTAGGSKLNLLGKTKKFL